MLDIKFIRENTEKVKKAVKAKQLNASLVDKVLELDEKRRKLLVQVEILRAKRNEVSASASPSPSPAPDEEEIITPKEETIDKGKKLKEELKKIEPELKEIEKRYSLAMLQIPNPAKDDVKVGKDDSENEIVRKEGEPKKFDFIPKNHLELGEKLGIIDVERAAKVSGARFSYLKSDAVLLELTLVNFAMETLVKEGFIPVVPPALIKTENMRAMGYMEHGGDEQMYVLDKDGLVLVGTSEQSIGPMHAGEILDTKNFPLRYVGFSPCFRREAGTYGKDMQGILRVHQFDKVEMFSYVRPEDSDKEHEYLLGLEEKLLQALEIPYQVVKMCTGDLGAPAARKYDLEAWIPSQGKYRELTSTSTCTDFQARRLNIKYREGEKTEYVHTLNGTAFAIGRTIIAILENYQQEDGTVKIPKILQKYMGKDIIGAK